MRRRLEAALPLLVLVAFGVTAVLVNLLLSNARDEGIDALEDALQNEVQALGLTQEERLANQMSGTQEVVTGAAARLEFTIDSAADRELLAGYEDTAGRAGFFLVDPEREITMGVLLDDAHVGTSYDWPGLESALPRLQAGDDVALPVGPGLTTDELVLPFVYPAEHPTRGIIGWVVVEQVVAVDSSLNREIGDLQRGETGEYAFYDDRGTVIASTDPSRVGRSIGDVRFLEASAGVHRFDGDVVSIAEVPSAGWRVAFQQDADEFEDALARPVQTVGQILILVLLAAGVILTLLLNRRLRAARAEQERLRDLNEAQQELISIVSHELRTPVAGVLGFLETTLDHWDAMEDDERRQAIGRAAANARRLQAMTRDVLDTQTVEAGRLVHVLEPVDVAEEVRVAVTATQDLDPDRDFELHLPGEGAWVHGDADRIQQVLANLLENARKNSPAVEPIEVSVDLRDDTVELAVTDHGAGIEPESLERIFEKFVRGRDEGVTGTGLGLYIARQIVDAHGGRIWAESEAGTGATFRVLLPRAAAPATREPEVVNP